MHCHVARDGISVERLVHRAVNLALQMFSDRHVAGKRSDKPDIRSRSHAKKPRANRAGSVVLVCTAPSRYVAYIAAVASPFRAIGSDRGRMPVASKIPAPTAGASAMIGVSPAPIAG
jgi:hypothetical protein